MSLTDWIGGSESKSKSWIDKTQQPYLEDVYGQAQNLFNSGKSPVANLSPEMQQYITQAMGFGNTANNLANQNLSMAGGYNGTAGAAGGYLDQVFQQGGYSAPMQNGVNMGTVNSLMNNDVINGQITASTRDIFRNLNENQMTGIASNAVGTGNAGSTRRGVAEGIAMRGANDAASDVAAGIRSNAYNQAVGVAANQAGANQNAQMGANQMNANLGMNTLGTAGNLGYQGYGNAYNFGAGGVDMMGQGGNAMQSYMQQVALAPWQKMQMYQQSIGAPTVLSNSSSSSSTGILPAIGQFMQGAGQAAAAMGGG